MKHMIFLQLAMLAMLSGCATFLTDEVVEDSTRYNQVYSKEDVNGFFVGADKKTMIVLGTGHHYVMENAGELIAILSSPLKPNLTADFSEFTVSEEQNIWGRVSLRVSNPSADESTRTLLKDFGFERHGLNEWGRKMEIRGKRYASGDFALPQKLEYFNRKYSVQVVELTPPGARRLGLLLTPVTLTIDGVISIGALVFAPMVLFPPTGGK